MRKWIDIINGNGEQESQQSFDEISNLANELSELDDRVSGDSNIAMFANHMKTIESSESTSDEKEFAEAQCNALVKELCHYYDVDELMMRSSIKYAIKHNFT